jgi:hypothetical protein
MAARRAPGLADWRPVNSFINTDRVRNVQWQEQSTVLILDVPGGAEGSWDRWHFILQRPHDTMHARLMEIENNVRGM